ncbi:MAG: glycosyltransferase, partial [Bacilli bacterium]|nr:glycosyltransferase [Bacilli bacterium]
LPDNYIIEPICISEYNGYMARTLRKKTKKITKDSIKIGDIIYRILWVKFSIIDYLLKYKFRKKPFFQKFLVANIVKSLKEYDLIIAHSFFSGLVAKEVKHRYGIPYCITWHGSDIHSQPKLSPYFFKSTVDILDNANSNIFVSHALLNAANEFSHVKNGKVLQNGVNEDFVKFNSEKRRKIRANYQISDEEVVIAFAGNLIPIKNASLIPDIFSLIEKNIRKKITFWFIGDGELRPIIENKMKAAQLKSQYKFFGNQPYEKMPLLMNCVSLLVLPSKNEGLPLVTVEALKCGAMVIGSRVGGIPEAIGEDNTVELGDNFIERFARRCIDALNGNYKIADINHLTWHNTAKKELEEISLFL